MYCKIHYFRAPFNFTHFALGDENAYIAIYVQNSITMPHLVVIHLMRVIKWPRSDSDGSCVNKKGRGYKGFYSIEDFFVSNQIILFTLFTHSCLKLCET